MAAVAEPAGSDELLDVGEGLLQPLLRGPETGAAKTWCVHEGTGARQGDQLSSGRRVPALAVTTDIGGREQLRTDQGVDQRRLARAGAAEQTRGPARRDVRTQLFDPGAGDGGHTDHGDSDSGLGDVGHDGVRVTGEVVLRHGDDGCRTAVPGQCDEAFDDTRPWLRLDRYGDDDDVDVGREHLGVGASVRDGSRHCGTPREHDVDPPVGAVVDKGDPVAGDRRLAAETDAGTDRAAVGGAVDHAAVGGGDAGDDVGVAERLKGRSEVLVPSEGRQCWSHSRTFRERVS